MWPYCLTHSSEVCLWVIALETQVSPLFADPLIQRCTGHHEIPQLPVKWNSLDFFEGKGDVCVCVCVCVGGGGGGIA